MSHLLYPELSYKIVGILFEVYNHLGGGYQEKYYQRAVSLAFKSAGIRFAEQLLVPLQFDHQSIGRYFIDFVVENKIALEIKVHPIFYKRDIKQVMAYLKSTGIETGYFSFIC